MAMIKWKECYETGIVALDKEHKRLVELINGLYQAIRDKQSDGQLESLFAELIRYTQTHFAHEERLLQQYAYPQLAEQQQQHRQLAGQVQEYCAKLQGGAVVPPSEVMGFMRGWLLDHIVGHDLKYGPYLESRAGRFVS